MKFKINLKSPKLKKAIVIALPVVFALTAAVAIALLLKPKAPVEVPKDDNNSIQESTPNGTVQVVAPVETPPDTLSNGLEFRSKGNGTCAVVGIGTCSDRMLTIPQKSPEGDIVTEIGIGAFADCSTVYDITLPDTVVSIGSGAFSNCSSLQSITVGEANPLFASEDGVLFNKTKSSLLCYPAGREDKVYALPKSVTRIADGAFSSCPYLVELKFVGTEAQWKAIYIGAGNSALDKITVTCTSADK